MLRLLYNYHTHDFDFSDSLSLSSDTLGPLSDCDLDDHGTPGNPADDKLWVLDGSHGRLLQFACFGPRGVQRTIELPYGGGPGQVCAPRRIALGRTLTGGNTSELFVMDGPGRVLRYLIDTSQLAYEGQYVVEGSTFGGNNRFEGITVDAFGQVYVATTYPSTIWKLSPQLGLLTMYAREGYASEEIKTPMVLSNPRPSAGVTGWGDLLMGEMWTPRTGGQLFVIGVDASSGGYHVDPDYPVGAQFEYFATDPHYLKVEPYVWDSANAFWLPLTHVSRGLKYSGLTNDVFWSAGGGPCGNPADYKFVLRLSSTYGSFYDTLAIFATLGDGGGIRTQEPLTLGSPVLQIQSANQRTVARTAFPCVGGTLQYSWSSTYDKVRFWVDGIECVTYTGPRDSVGITIQPPATGEAVVEPDTVGYFLRVEITDPQQHRAYETRSIEYCACPVCPGSEDFTADGEVNVLDVVLIIDMVFRAAPSIRDPGCPKERGDFDCDGFLTVFDVVFGGSLFTCDPCQT